MPVKLTSIPRIVILSTLCLTGLAGAATAKDYLLGPKDQIKLRVSEWRQGSSELREWAPMAGEFEVSASGALSLPVVGDVPASGLAPNQLAEIISDRLWKTIGLARRPVASVQISRYRPFYILGGVDKPGDYPYAPAMTVLQAVSTAGGIQRRPDGTLNQFKRDALSSRGDMREILAEKDNLEIREARLDAETRDAPELTFPPDLRMRENEPQIAKLMAAERELWDIRRNAVRSQIESYEQTKTLLNQQVASMASKSTTLVHEADLTQSELTNVKALVSKGYAVTSRQIDLEQNAAQYASQRLDLDIAALRAKQDISAADRAIQKIKDESKSSIFTELGTTRVTLAKIEERVKMDQALVYNAEVTMPDAYMDLEDAESRSPEFLITRVADGVSKSFKAQDSDEIMPGDTIRVILPMPNLPPGYRSGETGQQTSSAN
jgi:protein involved in polysaccharide export with SLBB domain